MKKKSLGLIIGLMGFALLGVMAMQLYFLRQSYQTQSNIFDRSVNDALNTVVAKLAKQDANNFLHRKAHMMEVQQQQAFVVSNRQDIPVTVTGQPKKQMTPRQ